MTPTDSLDASAPPPRLASVLVAAPARAQVSCDTLPNPIIVTGSTAFEPVLQQFAVKLAAESPPATIITSGDLLRRRLRAPASTSVVDAERSSGASWPLLHAERGDGQRHRGQASTITQTCTFAAGQTAHVAISDVFYESCSNVPQPRPADIADVQGPVQATVFVAATTNITTSSI